MVIDCTSFRVACACGQEHPMATQKAVIESGCLAHLDTHLLAAGLTGRRAALYDTNTYQAAADMRPRADRTIILPAEGLAADEKSTAAVLGQLTADIEILIVIGAGTLHDIARHCAQRNALSLISCPTAASVDGYASATCALTWRGVATLMPGTAPTLVLADMDIIAAAPQALTRAGIGEAMSKLTSLADWRIAHLLVGTQPCPAIEAMLRQAAVMVAGSCEGLAAGDARALSQLMYGLILASLATQMAGSAFPASGAEHLLSTLLDTLDICQPQVPHGEQVGACTIAIAGIYHQAARIEDIAPLVRMQPLPDAAWYGKSLDAQLAYRLVDLNMPDCLRGVTAHRIVEVWPQIVRVIAELPSVEALTAMQATLGGETELKALGGPNKRARLLRLAAYMRNQPTLLRLLAMAGIGYDSKARSSRAPSRKSRYADSAMKRAGKSNAASASSMR